MPVPCSGTLAPVSTPEHVRRVRALAGSELLLMPAAAAVVVDESGRVLLQRRADTGEWGLPGGIVEPGEDPADAAVRETAEETGVEAVAERLVGAWQGPPVTYANGDRARYVTTVHRCHPVGGAARPDGLESVEVRWFDPAALPELSPAVRPQLAAALAATNPVPAGRGSVAHAATSLLVPADDCSFCAYLAGDRPFTELVRDDLVAVLVTREQRGRGHVLVVPIAHRPTLLDLSPAELAAVARMTQRLVAAVSRAYAAEGVAVWQNNGVAAHQTVPHLHVHVAGTLPGGGTDWGRVPRLSVAETDEIAARLRACL
jgi:histidine triad (HIT) family protein